MSFKTYNQIAGQKVQRIEAISDGVFAIALTLLVLDIKVPIGETVRSERELFDSFCQLTPRFLSYFLSFMTLGIFWTGHTAQFSYIEKSDRNLNWISLFFLLFVSVIPFTTAFLSEHIHFRLAIGVYWLNIFLLGFMLYVHWRYAARKGFLSIPAEETGSVDKAVRRRIVIAQLLYLGGALLCFVSNYLSIFVIIAVQLNYALAIFSGRTRRESGRADKL
ncbi:MAG: TMEM175 family protein [Puia sp.]|nr:TMEM175 family protein [Puia sp.]